MNKKINNDDGVYSGLIMIIIIIIIIMMMMMMMMIAIAKYIHILIVMQCNIIW